MSGRGFAERPILRSFPDQLHLRCLSEPGRDTDPTGRFQCPGGDVAGVSRTGKAVERRVGRWSPEGVSTTRADVGDRPDVDSLSRPAVPGLRGDLPQPAEAWH